jgi:hypothetical protein
MSTKVCLPCLRDPFDGSLLKGPLFRPFDFVG